MSSGRLALLLGLLLLTLFVDAGQVISRLAHPRAASGARRDAPGAADGADLKQFEVALRRLRRGPNGVDAVRTVLGYLEVSVLEPPEPTARCPRLVCRLHIFPRARSLPTDGLAHVSPIMLTAVGASTLCPAARS